MPRPAGTSRKCGNHDAMQMLRFHEFAREDSMIKGIIFDVDGTLVDSVDLHAEAWQRVLARWGHDIPLATVRSQIGKGGDQLLPVFLSRAEIKRDGEAIEAERGALFKSDYLDRVRPFPQVAALFRHVLGRGQRIALGTSGKPEELEHHKTLLGIDKLAIEQTTAEDAARSKPHPDIFEAALDRLQLPADQVIAVGDTPYDVIAAKRAGLRCIGLLCGGFPIEDLTQAGSVALFKDPADLLDRFAASPLVG